MGCHILDPVFGSLALTAATSVRSEGGAPNADSWGLDCAGEVRLPRHEVHDRHADAELVRRQPPAAGRGPEADRRRKLNDQGSIYIGTEGVLYSPYIAAPGAAAGREVRGLQAAEPGRRGPLPASSSRPCRGNGKTSAPFAYSGPLTESVLLGCLATRFPKTTLEWDAAKLKVTNVKEANQFVRQKYRKGWEVEGL